MTARPMQGWVSRPPFPRDPRTASANGGRSDLARGAPAAAVCDHGRVPGRRRMLRLLLVDDHAAFRGALAMVLNLQPSMEVVAECGALSECRALEGLG